MKGLDAILKNHFEHIAHAVEMGVPVIAGSDAGSYGVPHGQALVDELFFFHRVGLPLEKILSSATTVPRKLWNCEPSDIVPGNSVNLLELHGSPFSDIENLRRTCNLFCGTKGLSITGQ